MSLADRLLKTASKNNKKASILSNSSIGSKEILCTLNVPMLNVALSGRLDGGLCAGILQIVGDSRCFKTCYGLLMMSAYLKQKPDATAIFFDSEGGASFDYFDTFGIDKDRVIHLTINDVEDLKIQCVNLLNDIEEGEDVFFFIDSVGLLPSRKEIEDAAEGKVVADMTRAKALNSFWRSVTIPLQHKKLPMVAINHYYDTMALYPEKVIKGGKGGFLASNEIWLVTRSKIKEGTDIAGWSFNVSIMKSRVVKENARIPVEVMYNDTGTNDSGLKGINKYSGLLEVGIATGYITSPKKGWYQANGDEKMLRKKQMDKDFWEPLLTDSKFNDAIFNLYALASGGGNFEEDKLDFEYDEETGEILTEE